MTTQINSSPIRLENEKTNRKTLSKIKSPIESHSPNLKDSDFSAIDQIVTIKPEDIVEYDVFISYNWGIKAGVEKLHEKLEEVGLTVWRDKNLVSGSTSLFEQLGKQIRQSKVFLCFLTKAYLQSDNCRKEFNYASKLKKKIIYLMIDRMSPEDIGEEVGFVMGNSIYTQCYKIPPPPSI
jgi:hypothetical protein